MTINQEMSMLEVAELLIQRKIKPQKFEKIAKEVCEMMGLTDDEFQSKLAQFYTDLTLSGKFVTVGEDKWDLKSRQKYDVANYDTYDIDFDDEEIEVVTEDGFDVYPEENEEFIVEPEDETEKEKYLEDEEETEDDYSDESDAEVEEETDEFEGLAIYSEDDFE
ncbi:MULTISPECIES: DNA-directed RNA polymerase subunit delta [Turicibacter]|jgi:DNA-directed RNA polymerase delta subunit|uniref:RNAP delta factor n=2 Tax=Turicibacter sanguinis TaxID=154288 RepID=A0A173RX60_9FIRM|nr:MULTISPECIES: DNA-directed RNA polymerase subunit delta [Turicibacter]EFF64429.1 putative DNA-directed RNA polymerase, delta subunit [Turicibacter sanguinis PC909]EGC91576.1 putative DNA-directed RNA polymerase, delta subunit [Turicibacter sp. HGF1]MBP3904558.1 DNA-directed RNA polymerase subunit delta [Turicibacter sp.]MCU7190389.1 DNA-directed RNA polymerase subunit delta [Turicibacter sanguinis]MCU7196384.1 DNA-directed RNA polymerase subunit delta [Turicibacter sanguinis]